MRFGMVRDWHTGMSSHRLSPGNCDGLTSAGTATRTHSAHMVLESRASGCQLYAVKDTAGGDRRVLQ